MTEWYKNKEWNDIIATEFEAKLKRSRGAYYKAQYLKIQAIELVETKNKWLFLTAESLANRVLAEYPDEKSEISGTLNLLGDIYQIKGDFDRAIEFYKQTLDFETSYPKVQTNAYLSFAELVVKTSKFYLYDEAEKYLLERIPNNLFPVVKYKGYSILAIITSYKGDKNQAIAYGELAEQFATAQTSGLSYHKYLGILKERDSWLDRLVRKNN